MHKKVKLSALLPNPYRSLDTCPLSREKIEALKQRITSTGFWANVRGREHPQQAGKYQIAFGHHRVAAAIEVLGGDYEYDLEIGEFGDLLMQQMMGAENSEEFGDHPAHASLTVSGAITLLSEKLRTVETLALPSRAQTASGRWRANNRVPRAQSGLSASQLDDLTILRELYGDEGTYQQARQAGRPGELVLCKFLPFFKQSVIRACLSATQTARELGVNVEEIAGSHENISSMADQVTALRDAGLRNATPEQARRVIQSVATTMQRRRSGEEIGPAGRRHVRLETARAAQQIASQSNNAELLASSVSAEMRAFMQDVPSEVRSAANRLGEMLRRARELNVSGVTDVRTWGNLHKANELMLNNVAGAVEVFGDGMTHEQRRQTIESAQKIIDALSNNVARIRAVN